MRATELIHMMKECEAVLTLAQEFAKFFNVAAINTKKLEDT